jgi:hypothetical protein
MLDKSRYILPKEGAAFPKGFKATVSSARAAPDMFAGAE